MADAISEFAASRPDLNSDLDFGPVEDVVISAVETALGAVFPTHFRDYLAAYAGGLLLGWEIYGIPTEQSKLPAELHRPEVNTILDIVSQNEMMKNPLGTVEFTNDGGGFCFAFIPSIDPDAVFVRGYGADWSKLYPAFHEMLARIADDTIRYPGAND